MRGRRRKQAKKPLSDSDSDNDSDGDFNTSKKEAKSAAKELTKKQSNPNPFSFDTNFDIDVKDGINDLAMLPRELIESELIQRGFQPDMTRALETKFLVNTLRSGKHIIKKDSEHNECSYNYPYFSEYRQVQAPIFDDTSEEILKKRKAEAELKLEKEKEEEEEMMEKYRELNPDEFKKENISKSSIDQDQSNEDDENNNFNQQFFFNTFHTKPLNYSLSMDLNNYGVDVDELISDENDPNNQLITSLEKDFANYYSVEDIFFRNVILNSFSDDNDGNN